MSTDADTEARGGEPAIMLAYAAVLVRGHESATWAGLCAVLGGTYLLSTVVLTRRG